MSTPTIGLMAVTSVDIEAHVAALKHSQAEMEKAGIKVSDVCLVTHQRPWDDKGLRLVRLSHPIDMLSYGRIQVRKLHQFIETDFILNIQADGFVTNASKWTDDFLKYDYIGAPWAKPQQYGKDSTAGVRVGNSGFSLRSQRFHQLSGVLYDSDYMEYGGAAYDDDGDDIFWTQKNPIWLNHKGAKIAPLELALRFSIEQDCPEARCRNQHDTFGQHGRMKMR